MVLQGFCTIHQGRNQATPSYADSSNYKEKTVRVSFSAYPNTLLTQIGEGSFSSQIQFGRLIGFHANRFAFGWLFGMPPYHTHKKQNLRVQLM